MNFNLAPEQKLLDDSLARLLADHYSFEHRKAHSAAPDGWSREIWARFAGLGILGLPFAEEDGGFGGSAVDTMLVMQGLGRSLVVEPYLATAVLAGGALRHAGTAAQKREMVPAIAAGEMTAAFAYLEPQSRYDALDVATTARREGDDWVLHGRKCVVLHGDSADRLVVSARVEGGRRDREGIGLFLVDGQAEGVSRRGYPTQDGLRGADLSLDGVRLPASAAMGEPGACADPIEQVLDEAAAAVAAEAVGAMEVLTSMTLDYIKTREQFGRPIGKFQVLQHRAADMYIALEQARSMALFATLNAGSADAVQRRRAVAAAQVQTGRSARYVGQQAVQLHGGIGMTMEYAGGHYFKRLTMIESLFGDADHHLARLTLLGGIGSDW